MIFSSSITQIEKLMSVLLFAQILRSYFLFSTVGFTFICDEGEQTIFLICSVLDEVWCVGHEY